MTKECKQQFTLRITQANSTQMVVILYEMALCYIEEGREAMKAGDTQAFRESIYKLRGCMTELMRSLHLEYKLARDLLQLYQFCIRTLVIADSRADSSLLADVERVIRPLHDAYRQIAGQNKQGPVMTNTQTVYAGLTYGKNTLAENMADQGANRGMLV